MSEVLTNFLSNIASGTVFFLLGSILTGIFTWRVVVPRVMKNKDVQELKGIATEILQELKKRREQREKT